ncbi:MAG: PAAR domain-containing protein, partial [Azoarcus sp.]|nr:PAAR domain-containing protein [Azoarcus sp.]
MADRPFIVLGDRTTHGGTVISADLTCCINDRPMARVGDRVVCPKCKGVFAINSGAPDMVDGNGRGYARHMDTTDCGARLIAGQIMTTWTDKSLLGDPVASTLHAADGIQTASATAGIS